MKKIENRIESLVHDCFHESGANYHSKILERLYANSSAEQILRDVVHGRIFAPSYISIRPIDRGDESSAKLAAKNEVKVVGPYPEAVNVVGAEGIVSPKSGMLVLPELYSIHVPKVSKDILNYFGCNSEEQEHLTAAALMLEKADILERSSKIKSRDGGDFVLDIQKKLSEKKIQPYLGGGVDSSSLYFNFDSPLVKGAKGRIAIHRSELDTAKLYYDILHKFGMSCRE